VSMIKDLGYVGQVAIACYNSPVNLTISVDPALVEAVLRYAQTKQIFARGFDTGGKAYHSKHMALIGERYEQSIGPVLQHHGSKRTTSIAMTSSLSARDLTRSDARDPKYWSGIWKSPSCSIKR
jgi:acyl transferase domain-containing protein